MDIDTIQLKYPIHDTLVGFYEVEPLLKLNIEALDPYDMWYYSLEEDVSDSSMSFIVYSNYEFKYVKFYYYRVCGYYTDDEYLLNYNLVIHSDEFGYEIIDVNDKDSNFVIIVPDEKDMELYDCDWTTACKYENMRKHVARIYDTFAYEEGLIFFNYDDIKKLIT